MSTAIVRGALLLSRRLKTSGRNSSSAPDAAHSYDENTELKAGFRLEPSWQLQNVGDVLKKPAKYPLTLTFWDRTEEEHTRHRNPIFDMESGVKIGLTILSLSIDVMHTVYLGLAQYVVLCQP